MFKKILMVFAAGLLSACSLLHVHKLDIEQGNIISQDKVNQVHPGMTPEQVKTIMGTPVLVNDFRQNELDYVYTFSPGYGAPSEKYIIFVFEQRRLKEMHENAQVPLKNGQ